MTDARSRAFSFVDRIVSVQPGGRITGTYTVPSVLEAFPTSLGAEAVGQLAAWAGMQAVGFRFRPVAGLAGRLEMLADVGPGQTLDLCAELEAVDEETVVYHGEASCAGVPVLRLRDCVGPMLPMGDFDDPQAVEARHAVLSTSGAAPGSQGSAPRVRLEDTRGDPGSWMGGILRVPAVEPLFADHFPRRPVFPGTLLMHANLLLADRLMAEITVPAQRGAWRLQAVRDVKLRTFTPPGDTLEIEARAAQHNGDGVMVAIATRKNGRVVASSQAQFVAEARP